MTNSLWMELFLSYVIIYFLYIYYYIVVEWKTHGEKTVLFKNVKDIIDLVVL